MNTPPSPPDPDSELLDSMPPYPAPARSFSLHRFLGFLRKYWWVPVLTLALALGGAITYVWHKPPTFVSSAQM